MVADDNPLDEIGFRQVQALGQVDLAAGWSLEPNRDQETAGQMRPHRYGRDLRLLRLLGRRAPFGANRPHHSRPAVGPPPGEPARNAAVQRQLRTGRARKTIGVFPATGSFTGHRRLGPET